MSARNEFRLPLGEAEQHHQQTDASENVRKKTEHANLIKRAERGRHNDARRYKCLGPTIPAKVWLEKASNEWHPSLGDAGHAAIGAFPRGCASENLKKRRIIEVPLLREKYIHCVKRDLREATQTAKVSEMLITIAGRRDYPND
jgi:hypothetical protein